MATLHRSLAASAVAALTIGTLGAVAAPASAGNGHGGGLSLTRSAAATLDRYDVDLDWAKKSSRAQGHDHGNGGNGVVRLRGTLVFDGDDANTTWSKIRINDRTNRVTAIVNGGDRKAVLKFRDAKNDRTNGNHGRTVLRLTVAGANSIDRAAGADAFDAGDAFARAGGKHRGHHH